MIFKTWQQVLDGSKTQTRRPVKAGEYVPLRVNGLIAAVCFPLQTRIKWQVGRTYAVQPGRGKKAVGRIRVTKIRRERLQDISFDDIRAEGIEDLDDASKITNWTWLCMEFPTLWDGIYKKPYRWEDNPDVWVLEFELA